MAMLPAVNSGCRKLLTCLHCHAVRQNRFVQTLSHYEVLGIAESASKKQIKDAFIKLSKQFHPDSAASSTSNPERFVKINEAYQTLSSLGSREAYDSTLSRHTNSSAYGSPYDGSSPQPAGDWGHSSPHINLSEEELDYMMSDKRRKTFWHGEDRSSHRIPLYVHVTCLLAFAVVMGVVTMSLSMYSKSVVRQKQQRLVEKRKRNVLES